jgi:hypothetical protein
VFGDFGHEPCVLMMLAAAAIVRVRPLAAGDGLRRGRNEVAWSSTVGTPAFDITRLRHAIPVQGV